VLAALVCVPAQAPAVAAADEQLRILVVGDSVTQGSAGDWTWRYRLWRHLQATSAVPVDLVGPRDDLFDARVGAPGNYDYVDPAFDTQHAARWGTNLAVADIPLQKLVETYRPDVVIALLGINDLALGASAEQVGQGLENLVLEAHAGDPAVDVVLAEIVQTWVPGAAAVNDHLHQAAAEIDDPSARVLVAETADGFGRRHDTYDGTHPSARGEVVIASAVADGLARLGIGLPAPRPEPTVPVGPRMPVAVKGAVRHGGVRLTWSPSPGADSYRVLYRRPAVSRRWSVVGDTPGRRWVFRGLRGGERVQLAVLPRKGRDLAEPDVLSNVVRVRRLAQNASRAGSA
jgi:lysophospholipase L1-like esterase